MIHLITDPAFQADAYRTRLNLPQDTITHTLSNQTPFFFLNQADRAVFVADLSSGGYKYQLDQVRNNHDVAEWFIFSEDTPDDLLQYFLLQLGQPANVRVFSSADMLQEALSKPIRHRNSCLMAMLDQQDTADKAKELLASCLPEHWKIETCAYADGMDALMNSDCAHIVLTGHSPSAFQDLRLPSELKPLLLLLDESNAVWNALHPRRCLKTVHQMTDLGWTEAELERSLYISSERYEQRRIQYQPGDVYTLVNDPYFVMWDAFGLPVLRNEYSEDSIRTFLARFDGCARLAAHMTHS